MCTDMQTCLPTGPRTRQPRAVAGWTNKGSLFVWRVGEPKPDEWKSAPHKFTEERVAHAAAPAGAPVAAPVNFD